ncbi:hypothetical protein [Facklamia sp. P9177]
MYRSLKVKVTANDFEEVKELLKELEALENYEVEVELFIENKFNIQSQV